MQSEMFASYAADKITNYISKRTNLAVNFERIEFQLYPIGSILKSVEVMSDEKSGIKNLYASEVGVYFDFLDFFSNKITVKKIGIVSAEASFLEVQKKNRPKAEDNTKLIEEIKKEVRKINHKKIEAWVTEHLPIEL